MKRIASLLLALLLLLSLFGCAKNRQAADQSTPSQADYPIIVSDWTEATARTTAESESQDGQQTDTPAPTETEESPETAPTKPETEPVTPETTEVQTEAPTEPDAGVTEDGVYDSKDEVALYIHLYRHLPSNYITKKQAEALGWPGGDLRPYAPGKCIGGSHFGNYEGLLPSARGREWTECDIDTMNRKSRGAKRIIFSNDGLIYYTDDHYESFIQLYDGWED